MKLTEFFGNKPEIKKAGFIPYIKEGDQTLFMFMTSSDPEYGGDKPMVSKGHIDPGESPEEAGMREAEEELGLKKSNLVMSTVKEVWRGELTGNTETYIMAIYAGQVKSKDDFGQPHYETEDVHWMTLEEFLRTGRKSQHMIVKHAAAKVV